MLDLNTPEDLMTEPVQTALISTIVPGVFGLGIWLVTWQVKKRVVAQHSEVTLKLDHITVLTNSTLATALVRIAALEKQVEGLNAALAFFALPGSPAAQAAASAASSAAAKNTLAKNQVGISHGVAV
jgi:hypothetical protein